MQVGVLGPVRVHADDGTPVEIPGFRVRMLLARLALESGRDVPVSALIDGLWGEQPPEDAAGALQAAVSRLRKALRGVGTVEFGTGGYRLPGITVDADRFEELVRQGRGELNAGRAEAAARMLGEALGLWQGPALGDVLDAPFAQATATRLDDLRSSALEDRFEAELQLGRHADVLTDLESAAADHPLSERLAALRMRALAAAGRQSDALAVYEEMRARLDEELGIDPSAILRDTHLALLRGELENPTPRAEPASRTLPVRLTGFVGRAEELTELAGLLADSRLVTIVGPGGAGKTRLALETMDRHTGGPVFFVPLAELGAPDQLADAVAGALDSETADRPDKTARLIELLDVGPAVLVLDNCEHVIAAAAALAEHLLDRLPHLRVLATSREPLAITGEVLCHLGPMDLPPETTDPAVAQRSSAVRLFLDRAAAIRPNFVLDDTTVTPVVEICRQLDGLPLALELAAAKLRAMSVDQVARRLDDRFRLLTSGSRTARPRQRTLLALVEWSWDLLEEPEKVLARRFSAFAGGATVEALEAVCADDDLPAGDIHYILDALVEKCLITVTPDDPPRYRMLETIRAYAADRLTRSGEDLTARFTEYFLTLAEHHEPRLRTGEQLDAIALFDAEHANMAAALRAALGESSAPTVSVAARLVRAMFWYWGIRGMSAQFETALTAILRFEAELSAQARTAFRVIALMAGVPPAGRSLSALIEDCVRAGGLDFHPAMPLWAALMAARADDEPLAERQLEQAIAWPDPWVRASAYLARDIALTGQGRLPAGADARREALRGFETVGDRWGLGMTLLAIGRAHSLRGEHDRALTAYGRAVALASELGTEDDMYAARTALAEERMRAGDPAEAERDIEAAQRLAADQGLARLAAVILLSAAELHRRRGDIARADRELDNLVTRMRRLPYPEAMAADHIAVARLRNRLTEANPVAARALLPEVIEGALRHGDSASVAQAVAHCAEFLAKLRFLENDPAGAATALGLSEVLRGVFDHGEPELATLTTELIEQLGTTEYSLAYRRGSEIPRTEALDLLAREAAR
ncbi:BTAD domain-containing putative transcriptional regulator [Nocardia sp. CDC160]|uniref:BTAD domain-containing putative transcriptional regulator n=1 Tax=Nocardia sp. CDC160 TaxID=3112166 RepID=UPI002DB7E18A|nr:BTAD domain-containing putative transcriptional regulator [Nocardia sp. CDC160]MEC3916008.1 BTAD domain-containing putative transcriptional regulator [Nocardia sp. CDC160]